MKNSVVLCLLVLVGCVCYQANGAISRGFIDDCDKAAAELKNSCHRFSCNSRTGEYEVATCGLAAGFCSGGQLWYRNQDLTKAYPECCPPCSMD